LALLNCGHTKGYAFAVTGLVGFVDPVAGLLGAYAVGLSQLVLAWALTFAPER
jgi:zinc transporter ZupT